MGMFILSPLCDLNSYIDAERTNRYAAAKIKKEMTTLVAYEVKRGNYPPIKKLNSIEYLFVHNNKRKDHDNVDFARKFIHDGMVKAGLLKNDGWRQMPTEYKIIHKTVDALHPKPMIIVTFEAEYERW